MTLKSLLTLCLLAGILTAGAQRKKEAARPQLGDSALLTLVQQRTFNYFWKFAHPVSGLAPERTPTPETVTIGGSGFGVMAIVVGVERGFVTREEGLDRLLKIVNFLWKADSYHGIWPHWLNGTTGKTIPFGRKDDGGDLVESAFMFQGLLAVKQYFNRDTPKETELRNKITWMWNDAEWSWYTQGGQSVLYWHWSPNNGWSMNHQIHGWNECLIAYILAVASPNFPVSPKLYHQGWAMSNYFYNGKSYYGIKLPLGFDYGGPLFFAHYSFLGLDPRGLKDRYADYWEQNKNHTLINRQYCIENPKHFKGYGPDCWGLTASDNHEFYNAHSPTNDLGVITPTAALSSFPYTPEYSMQALKYFYNKVGDRLWGEYGFYDAFNESVGWYDNQYLAIDQGPIVVMIENYRSGLLWRLFMSNVEIQEALRKLEMSSPWVK
ncbi:glucoamylase family protein [Chitinophaga sp. sic0106]|uniref:glucoamylase family protein n=1 Tax=Chitinophaga sp. sic0106 TaxID=2854785 RepID=UPI001C479DDB|nr:glucoamylase family protein [Chitinophaga sp. sic0106]MBV7530535.1 beta-glucosidase [Chitinophaga sp. sic0106]